jgi:hypothetical protein
MKKSSAKEALNALLEHARQTIKVILARNPEVLFEVEEIHSLLLTVYSC